MTKKLTPIRRKRAPRNTKTSGKRKHIFLDEMEFLLANKYRQKKRISFSAAVAHLMMVGLRAEQMKDASASDALALMAETINGFSSDFALLRAEIASGQRLSDANFDALHRSSAGSYLASRQLVAKLDPAAFDRLDGLTKSYLSKLGTDRESAVAAEKQTHASAN